MADFIDAFGRTVTDNGDGSWTRDGLTVTADSQEQAEATFNAMAPDGWEPPPPPVNVPASVEMWKLKTVLLLTPSKLTADKTALDDANALAEQTGGAVWLAWSEAAVIDRDSENLALLAPGIGFSDADIDAAFIAADAVTA